MPAEEEVIKGLGNFFDYVWGDTPGWVYLPVINKGTIEQYMLEWPRQRNGVIKHVLRHNSGGADVYYSPALFDRPEPIKENVKQSSVLWADFDSTVVDWSKVTDVPEPTLGIESSPGREHVYWKLDQPITDVALLEERNRSIAYKFKADTSGWDANQFLRPPYTTNTGHGKKGRQPNPVKIKQFRRGTNVSVDQFTALPTAKQVVEQQIDKSSIPDIQDVIVHAKWPERMWDLFNDDHPADRSKALLRLGYHGAENGFTDEQIYAVLLAADDKWGKYKNRYDRERHLLDIINRARTKIGYNFDDPDSLAGLIKGLDKTEVKDAKVVWGFKEFLAADFHVDWMLENLISIGGFGVIAGPPGVGKTQFGIQMGISLALGEDFLGWKNVIGKKKVIFLSLEMPANPLGTFLSTIGSRYDDRELMSLDQNFKIVPTGEAVYFDRPEGQAFIASLMEEYSPDVLFIDSFNKVLSGQLSEELPVRSFVESLGRFRHKHNCGIYMIHHDRKGQNGIQRPVPDLDDLYGNRFFTAEIEFGLYIRKMLKNQLQVFTIKNRLAEERNPFDILRDKNLHFTLVDSLTEMGFGNDDGDAGDSGLEHPGSTFTL